MTNCSSPERRRRTLTCPAVNPCPSASPATLLRALIALAAEIAALGRSECRTPIFRRAVREAFREVGLLLAFLEDVRDLGAHLPDSVVVGFSELHVVLQKLRCLLCDCCKKEARVWMLVSSDRVLSELQSQIRAISTALDVLPLASIGADEEVVEMITLLIRQSWEVEIRMERDDDRMVRSIRSILRLFESRVSPYPADLRRVLDRLGVRNWADCNEAIVFLEEEILEHSEGEGGEAALLGSLMGFLIYCRAVLFEVDANCSKSDSKKRSDFGEKSMDWLNPESFRCPISLELMLDPVTIKTGQTYDRASILRWFKDGLLTCPVTGEKLQDTNVVPNSTLQKLIRQFCLLNNIPIAEPSNTGNNNNKRRDLAKTQLPLSSAAKEATRMTAVFLVGRLSAGTKDEKNRAAYEIRLLTKTSPFHRACLVEADAVPWLLHLLSLSDPSTQDNAVAALLNLSKHPSGRMAIFEVGGMSLVIDAMTEGLKVEVQQNAAAILFYLTSVREYRQEIGEIPEAIPALVNLLKRGTYRAKKNAMVAMFGLLLFPGNHSRILATGVIPVLNDLLKDEREDLVTDCVGVLAKLSEGKEGTNAILRSSSDVLPRLVKVLESSTSRSSKEYSVSLMLFLCINGGPKVIKQLESMPLLMPSLYSIITGGPPQASKKARSLVNHIHHIYDQDYPIVPQTTQPVQDRVVPAL